MQKSTKVYLVLVDAERAQIGIEEHLGRVDVDRRLATSLVAQHPLRVDEAPE